MKTSDLVAVLVGAVLILLHVLNAIAPIWVSLLIGAAGAVIWLVLRATESTKRRADPGPAKGE